MPTQPQSPLLILGAGGHGAVVADAVQAQGGWPGLWVSDRDPAQWGRVLLPGLVVQSLDEAIAHCGAVHVAIGAAASRAREAAAIALPLASVLHPRAALAAHADIGAGCFVAAQAVVAPRARLGRCVIVNHGAVVDHDAQVGDFTHVAPLAALGGAVRIGQRVLVGAGAKVLSRVRVADDVVIGAGAVVTGDLDGPGVYAGVPARRIR